MSRTEPKLNSFSPSLLMQITSLLNICNSPVQFSHSSHVWLFVTPWTAARQARLPCPSPTPRAYSNSCHTWVSDPSNHLILCHPIFLPPSIFPSNRMFSNESVLCIRWPKYWSFSFSISPSSDYSRLISFRIDWLYLPAVQETLKSLLQHHSSKASILRHSAFFIVQLSHCTWLLGKP